MFESPGYFYEGPLLIQEYCVYSEYILSGFHFGLPFVPRDLFYLVVVIC